jgi:hypothetical protein
MKTISTPPAEFDLTLETGEQFNRLAVKELVSETCHCGARKQSRNTFCRREYFALPPAMRQALYNRIGEGYEEAYQAARQFLHSWSRK